MKKINWMIVGCTVPLLFIFLAPIFGIADNTTFVLFILAMFACHLFMPHHHGGHEQHSQTDKEISKGEEDARTTH